MSSILGHSTWWTGKVIPKICLWQKSPKGCCHGRKWKHWQTSRRAPSLLLFTHKEMWSFPAKIVPGKLQNYCRKSLSHKLPHLPAVATTWQKKQRQGIFAHLFIRLMNWVWTLISAWYSSSARFKGWSIQGRQMWWLLKCKHQFACILMNVSHPRNQVKGLFLEKDPGSLPAIP